MSEEQLYVGRKVDQTLDKQLEWGSMRAGAAGPGMGANMAPPVSANPMGAMQPAYVHQPTPVAVSAP
jgi:hypothetical protein